MHREYANNSFYAGLHFFSGLMFGAAEYSILKAGALRADAIVFGVLVMVPLFYLLAKKKRLSDDGKKLFALTRPYLHVLADFLFGVSSVSSFSILAYAIAQGIPLMNDHEVMTIHALVLLFNLGLFASAMYVLSLFAHEERKATGVGS